MRRKLFTFTDSLDGPVHEDMGPGYDYDAPDSVHNMRFDAFPEFEPNFHTVHLKGYVHITDLINSIPIPRAGWIVSGRLRSIFESFRITDHRYYSLPVVHLGKEVPDYWWFHLLPTPVDIAAEAKVEEAEAIIESCQALQDVALFRLSSPPRFAKCYVREDLKIAIEENGMTGIRFGTSRLFR
ncbi:hypothetical protein CA54_57970 [Symmachiella macrocystis]|uniref:Uncharacterized protein n=1 Tax=Symmachiella macrocystis TaxID=2527985 RepID=A0A5C6B7E5_9PLAN|nr:hypothetical protein CA54_57970 [Symmachiella macrocystis]